MVSAGEYPRPHRDRFRLPTVHACGVSGARDLRNKRNILLRDALELFAECEMIATWSGAPYLIENPLGKFSDHMGPPDYTFQPWQFGDLWSKKTCLWTGNGFIMPQPLNSEPGAEVAPRIWKMSPGPERANLRSETPRGFAEAVFGANEYLLGSRPCYN